jgi:Tol biopolymer transport system component
MESLPVPADNVVALAFAPRNGRLIYVRQTSNLNLWAVDIPTRDAAEHTNPAPRLWHASSRHDATPSFSPDGQQVAFQSLRSGWDEIWVADRNGSHLRQLTDLHGTVAGFPRWSPDGRTIVFGLRKQTVARLFVLDVAAARSHPVPYPVVNDAIPSWSSDGQWIYFESRRSGESQIWKVAAKGGQPLQVTRQRGWAALESADGRSLFYSKASSPGLWRMTLSDGKEQQLLSVEIAGLKSAYAPGRTGIYFIRQGTLGQKDVLQFLPFGGGPTRRLADIERPTSIGLALSPDERMIVYCQVDHLSSELMLVDKFR